MIFEEPTQQDCTQNTDHQHIDYTFSERFKYNDIFIKSLTLQKRLSESNEPRKYAVQQITGNEYGIILVEQPIIPSLYENRLIIDIPILQGLSPLRGCMRIGIVSRLKSQSTNFLLKKFKDHGCFMFSQDGFILHDQDEKQNMKRISDFSLMQGDILHLIYDGDSKTFSIENHSANTIHTLDNINLENDVNSLNQEFSEQSSNESADIQNQSEQKQGDIVQNYSFISSLSNKQFNIRQNQLQDTQRSQRLEQYKFDYISEEDELEEQQNTYHFAFMMGIGPSKIQIL